MTRKAVNKGSGTRVRFTPAIEDRIISIINDWKPSHGDLTGDALAGRVLADLGIRWSRQGILGRTRVRAVFDNAAAALASSVTKPKPPVEIEILASRVKARDDTIIAKDEEIRRLKEMIVRHHYNTRGRMSLAELEAPLPPIVLPAEERPRPGRKPRSIE